MWCFFKNLDKIDFSPFLNETMSLPILILITLTSGISLESRL